MGGWPSFQLHCMANYQVGLNLSAISRPSFFSSNRAHNFLRTLTLDDQPGHCAIIHLRASRHSPSLFGLFCIRTITLGSQPLAVRLSLGSGLLRLPFSALASTCFTLNHVRGEVEIFSVSEWIKMATVITRPTQDGACRAGKRDGDAMFPFLGITLRRSRSKQIALAGLEHTGFRVVRTIAPVRVCLWM